MTDLPDDLADALRTGPFHHALSLAIAHRGLTLDRLRQRLAQHGVRVSQATLSYWQTGRSQPERADSLRGLTILETELGLPPTALLNLVGTPRARGRRPGETPTEPVVRMWPSIDLARHTATLRLPERLHLHAVTIDDHLHIRPNGSEQGKHTRQVLRATAPTRTHYDITVVEDPTAGPPTLLDPHGYTPVRLNWAPDSGLLLAELILDQELTPGDTAIVQHRKTYPSQTRSTNWTRTFYTTVTAYTLQVTFSPTNPPTRCLAIHRPKDAPYLTDAHEVPITHTAQAHTIFTNAPAGEYGLRWTW